MVGDRAGKILIACYRRPYKRKSLDTIRKLIQQQEPEKVIVLSISETRESSGTIESYLGTSDLRTLKGHLVRDQEIRASGYSDKILGISQALGIPTEKKEREGRASKIILNAIEKFEPSHVIIHSSDKSSIDKLLSGSVKERVCRGSSCKVVILD